VTASPAIIKALGFSAVLFGSLLVAYSVRLQPVEQQTTSDKRAGEAVSGQGQRMKEVLDEIAKEPAVPILPDASGLSLLDDASKEKFFRSMGAYYEYRAQGYQHRLDVFRWQFLSTKIIFVVVIFLVLVGVYFSWVQFRASYRISDLAANEKASARTAAASVSEPAVTEIVASIGEVRVNHPSWVSCCW
jgi:hypothetical protein